MAVVWPNLVFLAGIISLFHAGYSAAQHRTYMRVTEQEFISLPSDIGVQGLLSLLLAMYGILHIAGDFKKFEPMSSFSINPGRPLGTGPPSTRLHTEDERSAQITLPPNRRQV
ncbi:Membrane magnesium transporter 2 [Penaeus vannamei]|uniref:Membrane magnesium transporter n=1 Tax=Penaeus vannamei TaxID=6689 RepID=A0A423TM04_PENVA|nr:Membrane magnesium transporter 2 [Penaeus vannamei]